MSHSVTLFKEKFKRTAFVGNYNCVNKSLYLHTYDITCNINIIFNINIKYFSNFKYPSWIKVLNVMVVLNLYTGTVNNRIIKFFMILISSVRHIIIRMCFWRYRVQYSRLGGLAGFSACGVEEALIIHKDTCSWCSTNSQLWRSARRGICQGTHTHNSLLLWHNGSSLSSCAVLSKLSNLKNYHIYYHTKLSDA